MPSHPVIELVKAYERFEQRHPGGDLDAFCQDYLQRNQSAPTEVPAAQPVPTGGRPPGDSLGMYVGRLYKFMLFYARKAMIEMPLDNFEDFGYLATLHFEGEMRKSALIQHNVSEFTSGTNVINRLLKRGLLDELPDPADARSKRVRINATGEGVLRDCLPPMWQIEDLLFGVLSGEEKRQACELLAKAEQFHTARHAALRSASREEVLRRLGVPVLS
jgi:DNA-binding MarR family transcriptional regulator